MTHIEDLALDEIIRFVENKFNVRISVDPISTPANTPATPSYQGTSSELRNTPSVMQVPPPPPPLPPMSVTKGEIDLKKELSQKKAPSGTTMPSKPFDTKRIWNQQQPPVKAKPTNNLPQQPRLAPTQNPFPPKQNLVPPPQQTTAPKNLNELPKQNVPPPQQQPRLTPMQNPFPPKQNLVPPQQPAIPAKTFNESQRNVSGNVTKVPVISSEQPRKAPVLERWSGVSNAPKISPGMEEALRLTAHVNVKARREEIERLLKAVESKFTDHDFSKIAQEVQETQKRNMMKTITTNPQEGSGLDLQKERGDSGQQGVQYTSHQEEEQEPAMLNVPDTLLYSLQINAILQLLALRQWKQAKQNLRGLAPYVQQGTQEDIFVRIVWSVFYNNYAVDLANQNNFRKAAVKAQKAQSLAEALGLESFRYIDHEYSYWAVLLNTNAIIAQALHRDNRHVDCARVHNNAYQALLGVQRTTNPNSIATINKTKMYAVNAIIFGIHAMDRNLLQNGVELLFPLVQYDPNLRPLLGHGYKNIGILELKAGNNDSAKRWFDAAMSLV